MRLSENFELWEFTRSRTAIQEGFKEQFYPPCCVIDNVHLLTINILQPLRNTLGEMIYITSGYRCKRVNDAVGGVWNSDHLNGMAADITCFNNDILYGLAISLNLPFKQMILYKDKNIIHISYNINDIRKEAWKQ